MIVSEVFPSPKLDQAALRLCVYSAVQYLVSRYSLVGLKVPLSSLSRPPLKAICLTFVL